MGFGVIQRNGFGNQGQNYVPSVQGSKVTVVFHYYNWVVCIKCCKFSTRTYNGLVVNELKLQCSDPSSFPVWEEFNLLFDVDIVNLPLKENGGETLIAGWWVVVTWGLFRAS